MIMEIMFIFLSFILGLVTLVILVKMLAESDYKENLPKSLKKQLDDEFNDNP